MTIIPESALVVLIGPAGCGKSTFAREHFKPTEILSSDFFRGMVSDDEGDQEASRDAFDLLHKVMDMRLRRGRLCVVDATNLKPEHRARLIEAAKHFERAAVAIVFDTPEETCIERAASRQSRVVAADVVREQFAALTAHRDSLLAEGFAAVYSPQNFA